VTFIQTIGRAAFLGGAATLLAIGTVAAAQTQSSDVNYDELEAFMDVYARIKANYVKSVDDHTLMKGAIDGMLNALDPHSSYAEGADFDDLNTVSTGNYAGLGILTTIENGVIKVISPTEDTPAWRAGIKPGDYITKIGGELVYGLNSDQAVDKMRGPPGSKVDVTVLRPGSRKPFTVNLTRAIIDTKPVKWEVKDRVGVINLNRFTGNSAQLTHAAISEIDKATGGKTIGYVLDLRSNGGGVLDEAVGISDLFLERGEIVSRRGQSTDSVEHYFAKPGDVTGGRPLIVLIDAGSASASEIVAGALQEHGRALVLGERSFGKGSVQSIYQLGTRRALRLTTELYYLPSGRSVQEGGVSPDIIVPQLSDADRDPQSIVRESDLRQHLIAEGVQEDNLLQDDSSDPRFTATVAELEKKGIKDFQLDYSVKTLTRIETAGVARPADKRTL
jgi:carboxyl-terminal processing protease